VLAGSFSGEGNARRHRTQERPRGGSIVDRYTKTVLTVIAAALVTIAGQNSISSSAAQSSSIPRVQVCDAWGNCASVLRSKKGYTSLNVTPITLC
jgi:hypothetical protein